MCGVIGVINTNLEPARDLLYEGLTVVQHRGQDSAGIITNEKYQVFLRKDNGLVNDVFLNRHMVQLNGNLGIAHVRYPTAGCDSKHEAQPFFVNAPYGLAIAHNGNLTNTSQLRKELFAKDLRHLNTTSDSEALLNIFANELQATIGFDKVRQTKPEIKPEHIFSSIGKVMERCKGAYSVVMMVVNHGLIAFRDPHGIRPLIYGEKVNEDGTKSYMVASESVALDIAGFRMVRDIAPGEAIIFQNDGKMIVQQCAEVKKYAPCLFEYVYFARPDSVINGISVFRARQRMGVKLAERIKNEWADHDIDVVIPIPDSSRVSALEAAYELGVVYREGFIKNRYIGRTFIMPGQAQRSQSVRRKLNPIESEFAGKNVLLIDDSIVRGTTSKKIIELAREAGANKVYFASAAPPVRHPNVYGIDMPTREELVAYNRDNDAIAKEIGADKLIYQTIEDLIAACHEENPEITEFEGSCFTGEYVTGDIDEAYLQKIEAQRGDTSHTPIDFDMLDLAELSAND